MLGWTNPLDDDYRTLAKADQGFKAWVARWAHQPYTYVATEVRFENGVVPGSDEPLHGVKDARVMCDAGHGLGQEKWLVDYKTASRLNYSWVPEYTVSNQFKWYYIEARALEPDLAGVVVDLYHCTKGYTSERGQKGKSRDEIEGNQFHRLFLRYNEFDLEEAARDYEVAVKAGRFYAEQGHYPKNAPFACHAFNRACQFLDLCSINDPAIRERVKLTMKKR